MDYETIMAEFDAGFKVKEDDVISVWAKRKHFSGVSKKGNKWRAKIRHPKLKVDVHLGYYSTPEEAALVVKNKKAEFEETLNAEDGLRMEKCGDGKQGRKLPSGVSREREKFRVRLWHPELKKYASFGYYSTCEEAAVVADRKRAELRGLYGGKPRGSSECEDGDKVLQETESEEAAVVADREKDELREVYTRNVRGSTACEDDDEILQETESEEAAAVVDRKRAELGEMCGGKVRGSAACEDDDEVLQETASEVAGKFECSEDQASDVKVRARIKDPVPNDRIWLGTYDTLADAIRCYSKEKTVLDTKMKSTEFEEQFKGNEDVNIVEDENCDGVSAKKKQYLKQSFGVGKKGNKWQARIRHPKHKLKVHLGYFSTPEEAVLVVKKKKAEFKEMLKAEEGEREKRRVHQFEGRKLPCGVSMEHGKFRVRLWHPELKKFASFGYYSTCDEAAVVADRKRAELREVCGGKVRGSREFEGRMLPCGVTREHGMFRVRLWQPKLKKFASFGYYSTCDEAAVVADRKRAELREVCGGKVRGSGECEDDDEVLLECESGVTGNFECSDEQTSDVMVPAGVRRVISDEQVVHGSPTSNIKSGTLNSGCVSDKRVNDQMSRRKTTCCLDKNFNSKKKAKLYSEPAGAEKALDTTACYYSPTSVLDSENSSHSSVNDDPNGTMVDVPFNLNIEPGNVSNFDEAVGLGTIINEYGQLQGEFSFLDESIWFEM